MSRQPIRKEPRKTSKLAAAILAVTVLLSLVLVVSAFNGLNEPFVNAQPQTPFIDLTITATPIGIKDFAVKLHPGDSETFSPQIVNSSGVEGQISYVWVLTPQGADVVCSINGESLILSESTQYTTQNLTFTYSEATEVTVFLKLIVVSQNGVSASTALVIKDPVSLPGIRLDSSTSGASYIINNDGNNWYYAVNGSTMQEITAWSSTNATTVINAAFDALPTGRTWQEKVTVKGEILSAGTILIPNHSYFELIGNITLADNSDCDMLRNKDTNPHDIVISGGTWQGNEIAQTRNVSIFNFTSSSASVWNAREVKIIDTMLIDAKVDAIYINTLVGDNTIYYLNGITAEGGTNGCGLHTLNGFTDSLITNCDFRGYPWAINIAGATLTTLSGVKTDGGVVFVNCMGIVLSGFTIDTYDRNVIGLWLEGVNNSIVSNGIIRASSESGYNTNAAIDLRSSSSGAFYPCQYNQISNVFCGRTTQQPAATQVWAYGVLENSVWGGTIDYNTFVNINANDTLNGNLLIGENSKITNSYPTSSSRTNLAYGVNLTLTGWTVNPANISYATDENYSTSTDQGYFDGNRYATGSFRFTTLTDLPVMWTATFSTGANYTGSVNVRVKFQTDGIESYVDGTYTANVNCNNNTQLVTLSGIGQGDYIFILCEAGADNARVYCTIKEFEVYEIERFGD